MLEYSPRIKRTFSPIASTIEQSSVTASSFVSACSIARRYSSFSKIWGVCTDHMAERSGVDKITPFSSIILTVSVTGVPGAAAPHSNAALSTFSICSGVINTLAPSWIA